MSTSTVDLTPYGQVPISRTLSPGWTRLGSDIGVQVERGLDAVQFRCARGGWYSIRIDFASVRVWAHEGYLPPRALLTVRHDSPEPTLGLLRPGDDSWDFSGGGGEGIDACGAPGTVHEHDSLMQRNAIGLYDMATGKLRAVGTIPVDGYYRLTRGVDGDLATNKVACLPDYALPANRYAYDDGRLPRDATMIPAIGSGLRATVLKNQAYDGQHCIRGYRRALLRLADPFVLADMRAIVRDGELAWSSKRTDDILATTGGKGNGGIGREFAWVLYAAAIIERIDWRILHGVRALFGIGYVSRLRRVAVHVAHRETGVLQRFVEGMSASPYPYGPAPASGVPVGKGIALTQHLEACAQIVALDAAGLRRQARQLARVIFVTGRLKWFNTDTGAAEGGGWHTAADDQAWPAIGVLLRLDRPAGIAAAMIHKVPMQNGEWRAPAPTIALQLAALKASPERGKTAWTIAELEAGA